MDGRGIAADIFLYILAPRFYAYVHVLRAEVCTVSPIGLDKDPAASPKSRGLGGVRACKCKLVLGNVTLTIDYNLCFYDLKSGVHLRSTMIRRSTNIASAGKLQYDTN